MSAENKFVGVRNNFFNEVGFKPDVQELINDVSVFQ